MRTLIEHERCFLFVGDSAGLAEVLPENSVDALCTDPPAGIGFMGRDWDSDKGGRDEWIKWLAELMRPAFRALKPGAHGLVWAIPRTSHWTAMALELAGFEVRDVHHHLFACVPTETEMLTAEGWKRHSELRAGEQVVQVNARGAATLAELQKVSVYPFEGELHRVATRTTEQLLTPGHTVHAFAKRGKWRHCERDAEMTAMPANSFTDEDHAGVVAWELPLAARGAEPRGMLGGRDVAALYGWVIAEGHFHGETPAVSLYQNEGESADEIRGLLGRLGIPHSEYRRTRTDYDGTPRENVEWYLRVGPWCDRIRGDLGGTKPTPPEWLAWLPDHEAIALFEALVDGDGSRSPSGNSGAWYQKRPEVRAWFQTLCFRLGFRSVEDASKSAVYWTRSDTTEVQRGCHRKRWSSRVRYTGEVWCPTVPQGRWVARYRGKVFVTGNTGFPKSLNISKAIDAHLGAERPVVGSETRSEIPKSRGNGTDELGRPVYVGINGGEAREQVEVPVTESATEEARRWEGFGTALKPAVEHWILVRKPMPGTYAANVLAHGTGALNIEGCRIGMGSEYDADAVQRCQTEPSGVTMSMCSPGHTQPKFNASGRWPAHLSLEHAPGCRVVGTYEDEHARRVGEKLGEDSRDLEYGMGRQATTTTTTTTSHDLYQCALGCPVRLLDEQSGISKSQGKGKRSAKRAVYGAGLKEQSDMQLGKGDTGGASRFFFVAKPSKREKDAGLEHLPQRTGGEATDRAEDSAGLKSPRAGAGRNGGARNVHPTVKSVALMRWLIRLITPPGGVVLDVFAGSGTTGVAALAEGLSFVGVEKGGDQGEYVPVIEGRLRNALREIDAGAEQPGMLGRLDL